jgi:hypothetical protein
MRSFFFVFLFFLSREGVISVTPVRVGGMTSTPPYLTRFATPSVSPSSTSLLVELVCVELVCVDRRHLVAVFFLLFVFLLAFFCVLLFRPWLIVHSHQIYLYHLFVSFLFFSKFFIYCLCS